VAGLAEGSRGRGDDEDGGLDSLVLASHDLKLSHRTHLRTTISLKVFSSQS
jgi:hypothetical protein